MQGLTGEELKEVVQFVQDYHQFAGYRSDKELAELQKTYPKMDKYGKNIKYVDTTYDTRDMSHWHVTFRQGRWGVSFSTNMFGMFGDAPKEWLEKYKTFYGIIMAYLTGEIEPPESMFRDLEEDPRKDLEKDLDRIMKQIAKHTGSLTAEYDLIMAGKSRLPKKYRDLFTTIMQDDTDKDA